MKKQNYGGIGVLLLCVVLAMAACTQSPFINSERTMPGKWLVEDIEYLGHDGWAYLPFDTGDMLDFADNGRFTVTGSDDYRADGNWWTDEKSQHSYVFLRLDGTDEITTARVKKVSGGRIVWAVYPQYWDEYTEGYPLYEITLLSQK